MDKQAYLEEVYNSAFNDELEKVSGKFKIPNTMLPGTAREIKKTHRELMFEAAKGQSMIKKPSKKLKYLKSKMKGLIYG